MKTPIRTTESHETALKIKDILDTENEGVIVEDRTVYIQSETPLDKALFFEIASYARGIHAGLPDPQPAPKTTKEEEARAYIASLLAMQAAKHIESAKANPNLKQNTYEALSKIREVVTTLKLDKDFAEKLAPYL